jgi:hypothetical protein
MIQQSSPSARAVQRDLLDSGKQWVLGKVRDLAADSPGYKLLSGLLGHDPITDQPVQVPPEELIHQALVEFVPNGEQIFQNLQSSKTLVQFLEYFKQQYAQLNLTWETVKALFQRAWDALDASDLLSPGGAWEKIKAIFGPPLQRLKTFIVNMGVYILGVIKTKVLEWLRSWATKIPGYSLLTFIVGRDLFTDEPVERTPTAFVKAVLDLVPGGDKIFENLQKSHTIERTVEWLHQEILKLDLTWEKIKALFRRAWDVISIDDVLNPVGFIDKIRDIFEAPALRVVHFALAVGRKVLEFIFEGVMLLAGPLGQRVAAIFQKAAAAFSTIVADPVAFLGHLIDAVVLGFKQFLGKIGEYLQEGVIAWLTSAIEGAGIVLPKVWDLKGILSLVLQILGITYAKIRLKLVKVLGEEHVAMLERVFSFLIALVTEGPVAAWNKITEAIGNFWDLVIGGIKNWAITKIIQTAVTELLTLFNPVGAVIEAIIETYRTIEFFVKKINQILALVEAIVDSIANIATGKIGAAANYVEKTLARTLPVIIGFLASLIGLGDVSEGIRETIEALQEQVDKGIDIAIEWIVEQVKALFGTGEKHDEKWEAAVAAIKADIAKMPEVTAKSLEAAVPEWKQTYQFSELNVVISPAGDSWKIEGSMSPGEEVAEGSLGAGPKLTAGAKYRFFGVVPGDPDYADNPMRGIFDSTEQVDNVSWLNYHSPDGSKWKARAYKGDSKDPDFKEEDNPGPDGFSSPGISGPRGTKPGQVSMERLAPTPYAPPVDTFAWDRLNPGVRVRGHIVNGKWGGPSDIMNMFPINQSENVNQTMIFDNDFKRDFDKRGYYHWYSANISYWDDAESTLVGFLSDFPKEIRFEYGRTTERSENQWVPDHGGDVFHGVYPIHKPFPLEILPSRLSS